MDFVWDQPLPSLSNAIDIGDFDGFFDSFDDSLFAENFDFPPTLNNKASTLLQPYPIDSEFIDLHELDNSSSLAPLPPVDCSGCFLLREVIHTNGLKNERLQIHGGLGVFYHAVIEVSNNVVDGLPAATETSFVDFRSQSFEQVKQFLTDYALIHVNNRYVITQDSLSSFFDTLCAKMSLDVDNDHISNNVYHFPDQGLSHAEQIEVVNAPVVTEKTGISAQRERAANLHINDLAVYFHLPISEASKEMKVCPTVLKKVCRKFEMKRWPFRKVNSIDKKITKLQDELLDRRGQGAVSTEAQIEKLTAERIRICQGH